MKPGETGLTLAAARQLLQEEALELGAILENEDLRLVMAESCSGGMAAAALAGIPGISEYFCGSFVTYRVDSKMKWLGISEKALRKSGVVSEQTVAEMAIAALSMTPEAHVSGAITGYLGPEAPADLDGVIHCAVAVRIPEREDFGVFTSKNKLTAPQHFSALDLRHWRQLAASHSLLMVVRSLLEDLANPEDLPARSSHQQGEIKNGNRSKNERRKRRPRAKK